MKTQSLSGLLDNVFLPGFRIMTVKHDGRDKFKSYSAPDVKPRSEPARKPAHRVASRLPASLQDWLNCKAALEISRRDRDKSANGVHLRAWARTAATSSETKNPSAMSLNPQMA